EARFSRLPRIRLSKTRTSRTPSSRSWSAMWEPIRPAPPTISTVESRKSFGIAVSLPVPAGCGSGAHARGAGSGRRVALCAFADQLDAELQIPAFEALAGAGVPLPVVSGALDHAVADRREREVFAPVRTEPLEPQ